MQNQDLRIEVSNLRAGDAERATSDLSGLISRNGPNLHPEYMPGESTAQDTGTVLQVVLGSGAVIALAKGIEAWMARWQTGTLTIEVAGKKMKLERVSGKHLVDALTLFLK